MSDLHTAALWYAVHGWHVFPCRPGDKTPATPNGALDATTDPATIDAWWRNNPRYNIGVGCGPSGLVVVDIDTKPGRDGPEAWRDLRELHGPSIENTPCVETPNGAHYYYCSNGRPVRNSVDRLGPGIDVRGDGGYVIAPPSRRADGAMWSWALGHGPHELPIAGLPAPIADVLESRPASQRAAPLPERITAGMRNSTLTSLAGSLRARGATEGTIAAALTAVNDTQCDPPLPPEEVSRVARSVARYAPNPDTLSSERDYGHAQTLAKLWRNRYRWAAHRGVWMIWTNQRWEPITEQQSAAQATGDLRAHYGGLLATAHGKDEIKRLAALATETCTYTRIQGALSFLKGFENFHTDAKQWDADPWLLNVSNGTIDLHSGTLRPHDPADLCTRLAPVDFGAQAEAPTWAAHLVYFLPNANVRRQVQRDLGLALVGAGLEERLPIWFGRGANGKSTSARTVQGVLGDYAAMAAPNLLVARRNETHPTEIADLAGRRCVFSSEVSNGARLDEAKTKQLTGGDRQKGRYMRQDFFEFDQSWTITLFCNHKPTITGTDSGIWRRVRLVPWTVAMPKERQEAQDTVIARLLAEAPGILRWLLEGLADWQREPHWLAEEVRAATDAYRAEQDRLAGFLADCCELGPRYTVGVGELYDAYGVWCEESGEEALGKRAFGDRLRDRGVVQGRKPHTRERFWRGIRFSGQRGTDGDKLSGSSENQFFLGNEPEHLSPSVPRDEVTLVLPGDTRLPLVGGKWNRLPNGEIEATYTRGELELAMSAVGGENDQTGAVRPGTPRVSAQGPPVAIALHAVRSVALGVDDDRRPAVVVPTVHERKGR